MNRFVESLQEAEVAQMEKGIQVEANWERDNKQGFWV